MCVNSTDTNIVMPCYCWDATTTSLQTVFFRMFFLVTFSFHSAFLCPCLFSQGWMNSVKIHYICKGSQSCSKRVFFWVFCQLQDKAGIEHEWVDFAKSQVGLSFRFLRLALLACRFGTRAQQRNILYVNLNLSVATQEFQTVHVSESIWHSWQTPIHRPEQRVSVFCIWWPCKQTFLQDNLDDPAPPRNRQNFLPRIICGKNTAFRQRCLVLGPHIPLALGNKSDEARELSTWWSFLDLLVHSLGVVWCRLVSSTLCGPLGKNSPSTLNWVSRQWLCSPVPSSWNGFHMAGRETFPVGRTSAKGSFCKGSAATLGTHPWAQCAPPSLGKYSGAQSVRVPPYWPQLAFLTGGHQVHSVAVGLLCRCWGPLCVAVGILSVEPAVFDSWELLNKNRLPLPDCDKVGLDQAHGSGRHCWYCCLVLFALLPYWLLFLFSSPRTRVLCWSVQTDQSERSRDPSRCLQGEFTCYSKVQMCHHMY